MENISVQLQIFVKESLHPSKLAVQPFRTADFQQWNTFVNTALAQLSGPLFYNTFIKTKARKASVREFIYCITELSNTIHFYLTRYSKLWRKNPDAQQVRQGYLMLCRLFEEFLQELNKCYPEVTEKTFYTNYEVSRVRQELRAMAAAAKLHLESSLKHPRNLTILTDGLSDIINQQNLRRVDENYLRKLIKGLLSKSFTEPEQLTDFLIINDFNLPGFFLFCVEEWTEHVTGLESLIDQKESLLDLKTHLYDLSLHAGHKNPWGKQRLYNELNKFLSEKYGVVKEKLKIHKQLAVDNRFSARGKRVLINLSVAQLGLFIRLQVEKGILAKEHIGELFSFFANHFYTPNTDFISPTSLQKKSSDVEHATAIKLKGVLISMLNWLNTHYNLSNYNEPPKARL